jgi:hypothetical protein
MKWKEKKNQIANNSSIYFKDVNSSGGNALRSNQDSMYSFVFKIY